MAFVYADGVWSANVCHFPHPEVLSPLDWNPDDVALVQNVGGAAGLGACCGVQ